MLSVSMLLAAVISSASASGLPAKKSYAEAYRSSVKEKKPLVIVIGAPWCKACNVLKETTLTSMADDGDFDSVNLVVIDRDEQPKLADQLSQGNRKIPQIIVYNQSETGSWTRRRLTGFQKQQPIRSLIRKALDRPYTAEREEKKF